SRPVEPTPAMVLPPPGDRLWYQLENNTVTGAVRLNMFGREPRGLLSDAMSNHATRWLEYELRSLVNVDGGGAVVTDVYRSDSLYSRRDDDGLPDVLVEWNRSRPIERVWSPTIGLICRPYEGLRSGDHDGIGELIALGPHSVPGRHPKIRGVDVAPTVAAAAGVFLRGRDGHPIPGLVPSTHQGLSRSADAVTMLERAEPAPRRAHTRDLEATVTRRELIDLRHELYGLKAAHHVTREIAESATSAAATIADVFATTAWIRSQEVGEGALISVVMPTRDRLDRLRGAVASVLAQTYRNFELIVVDDASSDGTTAWLESVDDERVTVVRNEQRRREGGSRNVALDAACGDLVAFLDDDNTYEPDWLRSLAWLFQTQPSTFVAYGARVVDDVRRHHGDASGGLPWLQLNEWDRGINAQRCLVDMNVLAHRRGQARFDPELDVYTDWDYLLTLTVDVDPVRLPVLAAHYTTDAPDRRTTDIGDRKHEMYARVRDRWNTGG
ncbi:MAG: glycosyltransferase, partial [Ilumatobacteraceae bacterium]